MKFDGGRCLSIQLKMAGVKRNRGSTAKERISRMPPCVAGKRSSIYRGVTRHRWTGRYEAHLWDKSTWNHNQNKKGKQVYLGAYDDEEAAARAYDLAALKYWGPGTLINFPVSDYARDIDEMQHVSREEYLASLRRKSSGFSRGMSKCRRLARTSQNIRWEARFSRIIGSKYLNMANYYAGEDCTTGYDMAEGDAANFSMVTNIDLSAYIKWWQPNKLHPIPTPRHAEECQSISEQRSANVDEPETPEWPGIPCEPYQLPSLGVPHSIRHKPSTASALNVLLKSSVFKQMLEKGSAKKGASSQDNIAHYDLGKVGLKNLISQEEHNMECKESGHGSRPFQPSVPVNMTKVPYLSTTIQECKTIHSHVHDMEGT